MASFKVVDKRGSAKAPSGIVVARGSHEVSRALRAQASADDALRRGRAEGSVPTDSDTARRMQQARMGNKHMGSMSAQFATQRPRDPLFYWEQNNLPYDTDKPEGLKDLRKLCRILYRTHPLLGSAIDIFSKWPITDMSFKCKDEQLVDFYSTLMFDQLNYEDYLVDIGREYWTVGEAWPLGSFNEDLGVWEDDELLNPDDVFVEKSPFLKEPRLTIRLPESLRQVLRTATPRHEYDALMRSYPELAHFTGDNARMPVSNILLKQFRFKGDTFNPRGVPLMLRGMRAIMQEEMLNSAQDAIADRLYTPLILAKLGASATDLGTPQPWVPSPDQIADFEGALDVALAADFRVLTTHFAVEMESVFGRETMPNFDADFERLAEAELQVFGLSKTMLSGAGSGETYAADALNRDLVSQLLGTYQRDLKKFVKDRMLVVAEAQGHYDSEERGGRKYPVMEEVLIIDPESGQKSIVEQPKLLVPDLSLRTMNMADEESTRAFYEQLRESGVPISIRTRMVNIPLDLDDEVDASRNEQVQLAVEAQETRKAQYAALKAKNLPIPEDLLKDFAPKAIGAAEGVQPAAVPTRVPQIGVDDPSHAALAPTSEDMVTEPGQPLPDGYDQQGGATVIPLPTNHLMPTDIQGRHRPPESDEQRARMPKPASVTATVIKDDEEVTEEFVGGLVAGPKHVGMRRHAGISKDVPLDEQPTGTN